MVKPTQRGTSQFSESAALEILDFYSTVSTYVSESRSLESEHLSLREQLLLEQCYIALGAKPANIEMGGTGPNTLLLRSATSIAAKLIAEGVRFNAHETVPPSSTQKRPKHSTPRSL